MKEIYNIPKINPTIVTDDVYFYRVLSEEEELYPQEYTGGAVYRELKCKDIPYTRLSYIINIPSNMRTEDRKRILPDFVNTEEYERSMDTIDTDQYTVSRLYSFEDTFLQNVFENKQHMARMDVFKGHMQYTNYRANVEGIINREDYNKRVDRLQMRYFTGELGFIKRFLNRMIERSNERVKERIERLTFTELLDNLFRRDG